MNRDERKTRPAEIPPQKWHQESLQNSLKLWGPKDSQSGGTWMAVNENNVAACLLNGYLEEEKVVSVSQSVSMTPKKSRGGIIPFILRSEDPVREAERMNCEGYPSFHLFVITPQETVSFFWDTQEKVKQAQPISGWMMATSSSWNQKEVQSYRQQKYQEWLDGGASFEGDLPGIHIQSEDQKEKWSVLMARPETATRSITQIALSEKDNALKYWNNSAEYKEKSNCCIDLP